MVDGFRVEVKGIAELQSTIKALEKECRKALLEGVSDAEAIVEQEAKRRSRVRTGEMRDSIREMKRIESPTRVESQVGTDVKHGPYNEYGTRYMSAQPFMRPALDNNHAPIEAAITGPIKRVLRWR